MRRRIRYRMLLSIVSMLLVLTGSTALGGVTIFNDKVDNTTSTAAVCLAAPDSDLGQVLVDRIRITTSKTSTATWTFLQKLTSDQTYDTEDLSTCAAPGCTQILAVDGVAAGQVYDLHHLNLLLPPGARLYMHTSSNLSPSKQTVEVYYRQR